MDQMGESVPEVLALTPRSMHGDRDGEHPKNFQCVASKLAPAQLMCQLAVAWIQLTPRHVTAGVRAQGV